MFPTHRLASLGKWRKVLLVRSNAKAGRAKGTRATEPIADSQSAGREFVPARLLRPT
jgi:hypothetical protein